MGYKKYNKDIAQYSVFKIESKDDDRAIQISVWLDKRKDAEDYIETMKMGYLYKDSNLIILSNCDC